MSDQPLSVDDIMTQPSEDNTRVTSGDRPTTMPLKAGAQSMDMAPFTHPTSPSTVTQYVPPSSRRAPSVTVFAQRDALKGAITPTITPSPYISRLLGWRATHKRVLVEGVPLGTKDAVFFAPDDYTALNGTATSFVNIDPCVSPYTVHQGDAFEISFLGISVSAPRNAEGVEVKGAPELLLYSLTTPSDPLAPGSESASAGRTLNSVMSVSTIENTGSTATTTSPASTISVPPPSAGTDGGVNSVNEVGSDVAGATATGTVHPRAMSSSGITSIPSQHLGAALLSQRALSMTKPSMIHPSLLTAPSSRLLGVPTGLSSTSGDVPFIHYDPVIDGHDNGTESDAYVPVPATKSLYLRCTGKKKEQDENIQLQTGEKGPQSPQSVSIRFTIMEIDKVSDVQARSISGVDQVGNYVSETAEAVPYLELLTRAFAVASALGKKGLKRYERPDHVHSVDMEFLLAERDEEGKTVSKGCGNYLQYGYYFFLSDKVDAKLYAQTCSSSQSVPLLLKREGFTKRMEARNEKEFFPLNGVSYLVAKVTRGCKSRNDISLGSMRLEHKRRLDNLLQMSHVIDMLAAMQGSAKGPLKTIKTPRR